MVNSFRSLFSLFSEVIVRLRLPNATVGAAITTILEEQDKLFRLDIGPGC